MQEKIPDLLPYLPWLGALALAAWKVWETIKKGKQAERDGRAKEVHESLVPVERRAAEAERLLALTEKHLAIVEREKLEAAAEVERLKHKLADRDETEDRLQTAHNNMRGRLDELERIVAHLRGPAE